MKTPSVEGEITNSASRVGDGVEEAVHSLVCAAMRAATAATELDAEPAVVDDDKRCVVQ